MNSELLQQTGLLFLVTIVGGMIPFVRRWSDEALHMFLAIGAGVFLGAVFVHLLPEVMSHDLPKETGIAVLFGFLLIFFIEKFLFSRGDGGYEHNHFVLSISALIGLSVHALFDGFALAVGSADKALGEVVFISIITHKVSEAFALGSLLNLAAIPRSKIFLFVLLFAAMTPIGALVIAPLLGEQYAVFIHPLTGIATGTFLYIATGELLPEAFHSRKNRLINLLLLLTAVAMMTLISFEAESAHLHD
ncbi:MAG: ZIP family metal transporter [candidate division Zixibacteria bacterium]|nr:ZIP family metal transporter [candidate division Zixibacteria bacterium]